MYQIGAQEIREQAMRTDKAEAMALGISFDGRQYHYQDYRYDRLSDAMSYARAHPTALLPSGDLDWLTPPSPNDEDLALMRILSIIYDGRFFCFQSYRYEKLADAVNYATWIRGFKFECEDKKGKIKTSSNAPMVLALTTALLALLAQLSGQSSKQPVAVVPAQGQSSPSAADGEPSRRLTELLSGCGVQLLVLDEFQHLVSRRTSMEVVSDWVKTLLNRSDIALLLVGMPQTESVLVSNPQLNSRFSFIPSQGPPSATPKCAAITKPRTWRASRYGKWTN